MYRPKYFAETDLSALDALIARDNLITLITARDDAATVTHLPVLYHREGDRIELTGHWARPNPQARHNGPAKAIVHGPHAYISPSWYPDKAQAARVPTWNYAVAHLDGQLETFEDEASLAHLVDRLSQQHEAIAGGDWRFDFDRDDERRQLRGIIGFRLRVERASITFKLNQNHPVANRLSVASHLEKQSREASREVAALMRARTPSED